MVSNGWKRSKFVRGNDDRLILPIEINTLRDISTLVIAKIYYLFFPCSSIIQTPPSQHCVYTQLAP